MSRRVVPLGGLPADLVIALSDELFVDLIGTFEEENTAYILVSWLLWVLPMTVTIAALMDAILVYCFMKWFHPWAGILGT